MTETVLVIEDEELQARSIQRSLERHGYEVSLASTGSAGLEFIQAKHPDVVLLDLRLPGEDGMSVLRSVRERDEATQVIVITAYATVQTAVEAMRLGAFDYITKPLDLDELHLLLERARKYVRQTEELAYFRQRRRHDAQASVSFEDSAGTQAFGARIRSVAAAERVGGDGSPPVLILGETGSGKSFVAGLIHELSPRCGQPFVEINCAATSETVLEAELFGYEKGAFGDGQSSSRGLFEAADGGTIFLDELGHIAAGIQAKLIEVFEHRSFRRLGSLAVRRTDVRIVAATSVDLDRAVTQGTFRPDLYHRLKVLTLQVPPLRERGEDVLLLAQQFVESHCGEYGLPRRRLSRQAKERLMLYHWPGNVRELRNQIERALLLESSPELELSELAQSTSNVVRAGIAAEDLTNVRVELPAEGIPLALLERSILERALSMCEGNVTKAARLLRISRDTLRYRIERLGLKGSDPSRED